MAVLECNNKRSGCYLGDSASPNIVNEEIIIASGAGVLLPGTVLGQITASKKYVAHDVALANGAEVATAILFHRVDATAADKKSVATTNGPATINGRMLTLKAGISAANRAAALEALRKKGLKVLPQHAA